MEDAPCWEVPEPRGGRELCCYFLYKRWWMTLTRYTMARHWCRPCKSCTNYYLFLIGMVVRRHTTVSLPSRWDPSDVVTHSAGARHPTYPTLTPQCVPLAKPKCSARLGSTTRQLRRWKSAGEPETKVAKVIVHFADE